MQRIMCLSNILVIRYDDKILKKIPFCTPAFSSGVQNPYTFIAELASGRYTGFGDLIALCCSYSASAQMSIPWTPSQELVIS